MPLKRSTDVQDVKKEPAFKINPISTEKEVSSRPVTKALQPVPNRRFSSNRKPRNRHLDPELFCQYASDTAIVTPKLKPHLSPAPLRRPFVAPKLSARLKPKTDIVTVKEPVKDGDKRDGPENELIKPKDNAIVSKNVEQPTTSRTSTKDEIKMKGNTGYEAILKIISKMDPKRQTFFKAQLSCCVRKAKIMTFVERVDSKCELCDKENGFIHNHLHFIKKRTENRVYDPNNGLLKCSVCKNKEAEIYVVSECCKSFACGYECLGIHQSKCEYNKEEKNEAE